MQTLSPAKIVEMFIDEGELYGLAGMFEGVFDGRLLHDVETGSFIWMSEDEFEQVQQEALDEAQVAIRQRCLAGMTNIDY